MSDRQEAHPNLKRGGVHPGSGRPKKEDRAAWANLSNRSRALLSKVLADMETEWRKAKAKGVKPKIDYDRLIKIAEVASRYAGNESDPGLRVAIVSPEEVNRALTKHWGDQDDASPTD